MQLFKVPFMAAAIKAADDAFGGTLSSSPASWTAEPQRSECSVPRGKAMPTTSSAPSHRGTFKLLGGKTVEASRGEARRGALLAHNPDEARWDPQSHMSRGFAQAIAAQQMSEDVQAAVATAREAGMSAADIAQLLEDELDRVRSPTP